MTERWSMIAAILATGLVLAGCHDDAGEDLCRDHYRAHPAHADTVPRLVMTFDGQGGVEGRFSWPGGLSADTMASLLRPGALLSAGNETVCESQAGTTGDGSTLDFTMACGGEDVIKTLEVTAFDTVAALEEVVVDVRTPATAKTFAVLRACPSPLYRLQ